MPQEMLATSRTIKLEVVCGQCWGRERGGHHQHAIQLLLSCVIKNAYTHLLFQITCPVAVPFPAKAATPEGDSYPEINNEAELQEIIKQILARPRTTEILVFLVNTAR